MNNQIASEQALIGSMLINTSCISKIRDRLRPDDFSEHPNKIIFKSILEMLDDGLINQNGTGDSIDIEILWSYLEKTNQINEAEGKNYLFTLVENTHTSATIDYHASILEKDIFKRKFAELGQKSGELSEENLIEEVKSLVKESDFSGLKIKPLDEDQTSCSDFILKTPPVDRVQIFEDLLPEGIVGGIIGMGGVSKSFLMLALSLSMASGEPVLGHFKPTKSYKVLGLFAEESEEELHRRVYRIAQNIFPEITAAITDEILKNLYFKSVMGQAGPLMKTDSSGNPTKSEWFHWLKNSIELHPGLEVLMIDPKSSFYGLEENSNEHNTAWIDALRKLSREYNLTILFSHHVNKASAGALNQSSSRGGSALVDSCRWIANLRNMDEGTAKKFEADPRRHVEFDISKNNYAPSMPRTLYFKRGEYGVLEPVNLEFTKLKERAGLLCELLSELDEPFTERELIYREEGKSVRQEMNCRKNDIQDALNFAKEEGWILVYPNFSKSKKPRQNLIVEGGPND